MGIHYNSPKPPGSQFKNHSYALSALAQYPCHQAATGIRRADAMGPRRIEEFVFFEMFSKSPFGGWKTDNKSFEPRLLCFGTVSSLNVDDFGTHFPEQKSSHRCLCP